MCPARISRIDGYNETGRKQIVPRKQGCPVPEYGLHQYMILLQNSPEIQSFYVQLRS
jgi:hypothetical protein